MKNRLFFKCEHCGNMMSAITYAGTKITCCGQHMTELIPNTVDAAKEKHVPVGELEKNTLTVKVGAVEHPMTEEHHIGWIAVSQGNSLQIIELDKTGKACAKFHVCDAQPIEIFEYCNLHGLWKASLNA